MNISGKVSVYKVEDKGTWVKASIRDARKDKKTDEWKGSFWNAAFFGDCAQLAKGLNEKDKIEIVRASITNEKAPNGTAYPSVSIFEFKMVEEQKTEKPADDFSSFGTEVSFNMNDAPF